MKRRLRDRLRDAALACALWPVWLATVGPGLVAALVLDRALVHPRRKRQFR